MALPYHVMIFLFALCELEGFICSQSWIVSWSLLILTVMIMKCAQLLNFMVDYDLSAADLCYCFRCAGIHHCYCHTHWYLSKWERDSVTFHFRTICKSRHESSLNSHSYTYVCVSRKHKIGLWWQTRHRMFSHYCSECNHYCSYRWMTPACWSTSAHSLAASPSPPGWSRAHVRQSRAEGGEGLANFAVD